MHQEQQTDCINYHIKRILMDKFVVLDWNPKTKGDQNANNQDEMVGLGDKPETGNTLSQPSGFSGLIQGTCKPGFEPRGPFRAHDDRLIKRWLQA